MKLAFITLLAFSSICSWSQKKGAEDLNMIKTDIETLDRSIKTLNYLHKINSLYKDLYIGTMRWVYFPTDFSSKQRLRESHSYEYPILMGNSIRYKLQPSVSTKIDSVELILKELVQHTEHGVLANLQTFEDYDDESRLNESKEKIRKVIIPLLYKGNTMLTNLIEHEKLYIKDKLDVLVMQAQRGLVRMDKETLFDVGGMLQEYQKQITLYRLKDNSWKLYSGTFNWVYKLDDYMQKESLKQNSDGLAIIIKSLKNEDVTDGHFFRQDSLLTDLNNMVSISRETIRDLVTDESYEDPLIFLPAEDRLASALSPVYLKVLLLLDKMIVDNHEHMELLLLGFGDPKLEDAKKLVRLSLSSLDAILEKSISEIKDSRIRARFRREDIVTEIAKIYCKHFSRKEIQEILRFQKSRVGEKMNNLSVDMLRETTAAMNDYLVRLKDND